MHPSASRSVVVYSISMQCDYQLRRLCQSFGHTLFIKIPLTQGTKILTCLFVLLWIFREAKVESPGSRYINRL